MKTGNVPVRLEKLLGSRGLHLRAREGAAAVFSLIGEVRKSLRELAARAQNLRQGLALEVDAGVRFTPDSLNQTLAEAIRQAEVLGDQLKAITVAAGEKGGQDLTVTARTWEGEELARRQALGLSKSLEAITAAGSLLESANSRDEAEIIVAGILLRTLGAVSVKAYEVAEDGSVQVSSGYHLVAGKIKKELPHEITSHFSARKSPDEYRGEAMEAIVSGEQERVLILDPSSDPRAQKGNETNPFILLREPLAERVARVYKVAWERAEDAKNYAPPLRRYSKHCMKQKQESQTRNWKGFLSKLTP